MHDFHPGLGWGLATSDCDPSDHLQESLDPPSPKSQKSLKKSLFGDLQKSLRKYLRKSQNTPKSPTLGVFFDSSGIFGDFFADPQISLFETFLGFRKWSLGSQTSAEEHNFLSAQADKNRSPISDLGNCGLASFWEGGGQIGLGSEKYPPPPPREQEKKIFRGKLWLPLHPHGREGDAAKTRKAISTIAILWPVKAILEKRAATVEVDTLISPCRCLGCRKSGG